MSRDCFGLRYLPLLGAFVVLTSITGQQVTTDRVLISWVAVGFGCPSVGTENSGASPGCLIPGKNYFKGPWDRRIELSSGLPGSSQSEGALGGGRIGRKGVACCQ